MLQPHRSVRRLAALLCTGLALLALEGCGDACRDLATQICLCYPDNGQRTVCNTNAKNAEQFFPVGKADAAWCQQQLSSNACDCTQLYTNEGRAACGVAWTTGNNH